MNNYKNKNITIFGLAKSGIAAAKKLSSLGAKVLLTEVKPAADFNAEVIQDLRDLDIDLELAGHTAKSIDSAEMIVVSPGINSDIPILKQAQQKGIPIISEVELAFQLLQKPIIAVTGTNGKTTTTTLIGELLRAGGKKIAMAGNIGNPLVEVDDADLDFIVAEISSYQLETIDKFRPFISVILNIQPDHLQRHGSMQEYIKQKAKIFVNQQGDDFVVFNSDDLQVIEMVKKAQAKTIGFSKSKASIITLNPEEIRIPGRHNLENSLAAAQAAYLCGVDKKTVADVLKTFPGVEHRIEFVTSINGINFYNDSKATNPDSTLVALETFWGQGIILILGGRDKGVDLGELVKKVKEGVKEVILIGEATSRFKDALQKGGFDNISLANSMEEVVKMSLKLAKSGDVVLLSPACASFDMFSNYEERGRVFKEIVNTRALTLGYC